MIDRVEHHLRHLRAGGIVEEREIRFSVQRRESCTNSFDRKAVRLPRWTLAVENAFGLRRQFYSWRSGKALQQSWETNFVTLLLRRVLRQERRFALVSSDLSSSYPSSWIKPKAAKMPVFLTNSKLIYETLKECDIRLVSALPETWLVHLIRMTDEDPEMTLVRLAKEEEAVGISAGAYFAGVKSAMLMQNHGFLASINGIVSFAHLYKIPLLMLISYRGSFGERDPWQTQGGNVTEPVLRALRIPYFFLDSIETVKKRIRDAHTLAESSLQPVAALLTRDLMWEE